MNAIVNRICELLILRRSHFSFQGKMNKPVHLGKIGLIRKGDDIMKEEASVKLISESTNNMVPIKNSGEIQNKMRYVLGRGYDLTQYYAHSEDVKDAVINLEKVVNPETRNPDIYVYKDPNISRGESKMITGETFDQYQRNYSRKVALSGDVSAVGKASLSGEVNHNFSQESSATKDRMFSTKMLYKAVDAYLFNIRNAESLSPFLSDGFIKDIDSQNFNAKAIIKKYGTHVVLGGILGGRLDYHLSTTSNKSGAIEELGHYTEAKAGASIKGVSASATASAEEVRRLEKEYKFTSTEESTLAYGGDISLAISDGDFDKWVASIDDKNMVWMDFYNNSLVLLSDFVKDPTKRHQLRSEILRMLKHAINLPSKTIEEKATKHSGTGTDINSDETDWTLTVKLKPGDKNEQTQTFNTLNAEFTYIVKERKATKTGLKMTSTETYDITKYAITELLDEMETVKGTIYGKQHEYVKIGNFGIITGLEVKIDGKGKDLEHLGVRCSLNVAVIDRE